MLYLSKRDAIFIGHVKSSSSSHFEIICTSGPDYGHADPKQGKLDRRCLNHHAIETIPAALMRVQCATFSLTLEANISHGLSLLESVDPIVSRRG